jgi:fructose-specific PTS system IIA-like component
MRIFSKLARRIMHDSFRDALMHSATAAHIEALLKQELEL